jgi:hypothetical protein
MARAHKTAAAPEAADHDIRESLATIREQTRETIELLRSLINLLLDQHSLREGPPLEDLIAILIVQQRQVLTIAQHIQGDLRGLRDCLAGGGTPDRNARVASDGRAPPC